MGLIAIWPVMRKLLEAFGTNPAALLATISKGNRIADLDAQTSFRDKFAKEFRDVTRALGDDFNNSSFLLTIWIAADRKMCATFSKP